MVGGPLLNNVPSLSIVPPTGCASRICYYKFLQTAWEMVLVLNRLHLVSTCNLGDVGKDRENLKAESEVTPVPVEHSGTLAGYGLWWSADLGNGEDWLASCNLAYKPQRRKPH